MNRRSAPRFPLTADVLLVTPGPDGPDLSTGRTVEVSLGGCSVELDRPLDGATSSGVILVQVDGRELTMLTAPITGQAAAAERLELRFLAPTEPDPAWADLIDSLDAAPG